MGRVVRKRIYLFRGGRLHSFRPGDVLPAWAEPLVTNPSVTTPGEQRAGVSVAEHRDGPVGPDTSSASPLSEPPRAGKGSGIAAWRAHLDALGIGYDADESREQLIARFDSFTGS